MLVNEPSGMVQKLKGCRASCVPFPSPFGWIWTEFIRPNNRMDLVWANVALEGQLIVPTWNSPDTAHVEKNILLNTYTCIYFANDLSLCSNVGPVLLPEFEISWTVTNWPLPGLARLSSCIILNRNASLAFGQVPVCFAMILIILA